MIAKFRFLALISFCLGFLLFGHELFASERRSVCLSMGPVKSIEDFHEKFAAAMGFPDYYGENLDALYDMLIDPEYGNADLVWKDFLTTAGSLEEFSPGYFVEVVGVFKEASAFGDWKTAFRARFIPHAGTCEKIK